MSSHPLKRNNTTNSSTTTHHANTTTTTTPPNRSSAPRYDSLSHSDNDPNISGDDYSNEDETYSDALSGGYDEYDDLNSEAQEYYNSGASELVTTVR